MAVPFLEPAFSNGEITPALFGRLDIDKFHTAAATLRNTFVNFRGGANSRAGFAYALMSLQSGLNPGSPPRLVTFNFSLAQSYALELGDHYMRIYSNGSPVVENAQTISAITTGSATFLTIPGNDLAAGDWVIVSGCQGTPQFNGNCYVVSGVSGSTVGLMDFDGGPINSLGFGSYVADSGSVRRVYTVVSPYLAADAWLCKFTQSANEMTIANPNFPPYNLERLGPLNWQFVQDVRAPTIGRPQSPSATPNVTAADLSGSTPPPQPAAYAYKITAVAQKTAEESEGSLSANVTDSVDMASTLGSITVTWGPVTSADYYNVYRAPTSYATAGFSVTPPANALPVPVGSIFGLVGQSIGTEFVDTNLTPDFVQSPPQGRDPLSPGQVTGFTITAPGSGYNSASIVMNTSTGSGFIGEVIIVSNEVVGVLIVNPGSLYAVSDTCTITSGSGSGATATPVIGPETGTYPSVVSYFQQRRVYANSTNEPDTYWMSQTGNFDNFDVSIPVGASDAITGTPSAQTVDGIQWMLEMPLGLVTFTGAAIMQVTAAGTFISSPTAITPTNQIAVPQSTAGSSATLEPVRVDWNILHYEPDNAILRELNYQIYLNIYISKDISWQSSHLLFGHQLIDRAWTRKPHYLLWHVRDDGVLISTTYVKDQEVVAWARHTTQGQFRSVTSVYEAPVDALYAAIERPVAAGGTRYFIERMDDRIWFDAEDPWCVDCGVASNLPARGGTLMPSKASGNAVFRCSQDVFVPGDVGSTIRSGAGIAVVTIFDTASAVRGTWIVPTTEVYPDSPLAQPIPQSAWTIRAPISNVTGLPPYSDGWSIVGLADGIPIGPLVVTAAGGSSAIGGEATLPFPASDIKLGLGFGVQAQSVYLDGGNPTVQGRVKSINAVTCRVENSAPLTAGANQPDASVQNPMPLVAQWANMSPAPSSPDLLPPTYISPGTFLLPADQQQTVQPPFTGDIRVTIPAEWRRRGQVAAQQSLPQPLNLLAFIPEADEGDMPEAGYSQRPPQPPSMLAGAMAHWPPQARR